MARRTRSSISTVKEEVIDGEDIVHDARIQMQSPTPAADPQGEPEPSTGRVRNVLRGTRTAAATSAAGAAAADPPPHSSPGTTSRFFPSSSSSLTGRKRKPMSSSAPLRRGASAAVGTGVEEGVVPKATTSDTPRTPTGALAIPPAVDIPRRSSSRLHAVKMEELAGVVKLEEISFAAAAGATSEVPKGDPSIGTGRKPSGRRAAVARIGDGKLQHTEKKRERKMRKVPKKAKIEAQTGLGGTTVDKPRDTLVSPRLAEKAALILQVMDKLYPDPPIPINHVVRMQ